MQFAAALVLSLIGPVHGLTPLAVEGDGNYSPLGQRFGPQTINNVGNFLLHAFAIVALSTAPLAELPLLAFLLGVLPTHVFLGVVLQGAPREQIGLYQRRLWRNVLDYTDKVSDDEFSTRLRNLAPGACRSNK